MAKPSKTRNSLIWLWQVKLLLKSGGPELQKRRYYIHAELKRRFLHCPKCRLGALLDEIERRQRRKAKITFWSELALDVCRHFKFTGIEYNCFWYDWGPEWRRVKWRRGHGVAINSVLETEINRRHRRKGWIK